MFGQPKALASLSSGLLARKGQARPAMRPQGFNSFGSGTPAADDLGWNDMGPPPADAPAVLVVREALKDEIESSQGAAQPIAAPVADPPPRAVKPVSVATAMRISREGARATKAAFTLRLDADRHLRLRLASAVTNRSAQAIVAHALEEFLQTLPEVDALVAQLPTKSR